MPLACEEWGNIKGFFAGREMIRFGFRTITQAPDEKGWTRRGLGRGQGERGRLCWCA